MMFYENRETILYKVIVPVTYTMINNYIGLDYLSLLQDNLSRLNNRFEKTKFKDLSGLVIPDTLMNIMSCCGFSESPISTVILTFRVDSVTHYLSKVFVIIETEEGGIDNIIMSLKIQTHDDNLYQ